MSWPNITQVEIETLLQFVLFIWMGELTGVQFENRAVFEEKLISPGFMVVHVHVLIVVTFYT